MAEYMLLIVGDYDAYEQLSEDEGKALYAGHEAFMAGLRDAGVALLSSAELDHPGTARTILGDGTVTDGPFAEAKEQIGGYYSIDVPSIEEAVAWGKKIPLLPTDKLEVRKAK
jgi:hypothetical protein